MQNILLTMHTDAVRCQQLPMAATHHMNSAIPNTTKLPVKITTRRVYLGNHNYDQYIVHPGLKKRWQPPVIGYVCRVTDTMVQVALVVRQATWHGEPFHFAERTFPSRGVVPVDASNLWDGCFYVPKEEAGAHALGFLPHVPNASVYTTVPERYWAPFRKQSAAVAA